MKNDPRDLIARFESICPETGKTIRKGDACVYFPLYGLEHSSPLKLTDGSA